MNYISCDPALIPCPSIAAVSSGMGRWLMLSRLDRTALPKTGENSGIPAAGGAQPICIFA